MEALTILNTKSTLITMLHISTATRHLPEEASAILRATARQRAEGLQGQGQPYADPYFWTGFHVIGW
jgi:CHAT domain-containing protein